MHCLVSSYIVQQFSSTHIQRSSWSVATTHLRPTTPVHGVCCVVNSHELIKTPQAQSGDWARILFYDHLTHATVHTYGTCQKECNKRAAAALISAAYRLVALFLTHTVTLICMRIHTCTYFKVCLCPHLHKNIYVRMYVLLVICLSSNATCNISSLLCYGKGRF